MTPSLTELIDRRFGLPLGQAKGQPTYAVLASILGRRSGRKFAARPVPEPLLEAVLACAQSAGSKSDLQAFSILRLRDPSRRDRLAELCASPWMKGAPVHLVFCGDLRRNRRICERHALPFAQNNLDGWLNAAVDAALALQSCLIAAEGSGLAGCPVSAVRNAIGPVTELLRLPPGVFPLLGLALGYPTEPGRVSMRLPPSLVVHEETYRDAEVEEEIGEYDRRRDAREPIPPEKQKQVERYGLAEKCTWSLNVARQLSVEERADLAAYLRRQGFRPE